MQQQHTHIIAGKDDRIISAKWMIGQCTYRYCLGQSLKGIYDDLKAVCGHEYASVYFGEFIKAHKHKKEFVEEFNNTAFIDNIHSMLVKYCPENPLQIQLL